MPPVVRSCSVAASFGARASGLQPGEHDAGQLLRAGFMHVVADRALAALHP